MIIDTSDKQPDANVIAPIVYPEPKPIIDFFGKLKCQHCNTHMNGGTICPSCGKAKE